MPSNPSLRIARQPGEAIDRAAKILFRFDGKEYFAYSGDTIASALTAAGVKVLSRSFKYHRPRGLLCCSGDCPNCLVQVGDEPNVRSCTRLITPGLEVRSQNAWPSLKSDLMSLTQHAARFMPVGFYYKTFIRPSFLWPLYERTLRKLAGLGTVNSDTPPDDYDKQYLHADVAVVGGGPSGMSAAIGAADRGARVILFDRQPTLGGHLRFSSKARLPDLLNAVQKNANIEVFSDTTIQGWYEEKWLSASRGNRLFKIRAKSTILASGAHEIPLIFDNNDLPGVMLGSAVQRLLHLYGVSPGSKFLIVTANEDGWHLAEDLQSAGLEVAGIVEERSQEDCTRLGLKDRWPDGAPVYYEHTILQALGGKSVKRAIIGRLGSDGMPDPSTKRSLECDGIAVSVGWTPRLELLFMAGGKTRYNVGRSELLPESCPPQFYVTGRAVGLHDVQKQMAHAKETGTKAAQSSASALWNPPSFADEPIRTSAQVSVPGKMKRFVCYCEDISPEDIDRAIAEGYDSIELLKRYSTISMGPCQGKMCSMNTIHLCARANNATVQETGKTTARPPTTPLSLGILAGQNMEPIRRTAIHDWHLNQNASIMVAGLWLRPEHYGDPNEEVLAVNHRVGIIDVSTLGKLKLTGPGVPDLLQRIYLNKWRKLPVGRVRYGLMCNDEGIIIDDGLCARVSDEEWYMSTTSSGATGIYEWIQWWMQSGWGEGVHLTNVTEAFSAFNVTGPRVREVLKKITSCDLGKEEFPYMSMCSSEVAGVECRVMRIGFTGELSYEIHCPSAYALHVWEALLEAGQEFGILPFGVEAQRTLRLQKGHIIVGQDTDALSDPISANMDWVVKLDKPDFLGRRAATRISAEGTKHLLVGFKMDRPGVVPEEGMQIVDAPTNEKKKIIGWVTSSRFSPTLNETIGLCWLPTTLGSKNGTSFSIQMNGTVEEAHVFHGAFYDPKGEKQNS